ncbi:MAG TPA: choice-of-anchor J domain-containing protein [Ignavibacteria bacterium]|nr:choice-of-anchor J domain-containing protein [Ignavibacteria bacterium]HRJ04227.1 choice-of-anchor J domain-containing protein [Ignavibacteria bacterium]HRJ84705.1 choice-of-anchor J domain-containing protein [Ignavibacteria bacterium]
MKKYITILLFILTLSPFIYSQRVLMNETFETSGFTGPDSLPSNWVAVDADATNPSHPNAIWRVRDTSATFPGVNASIKSRANFFTPRGLSIPWRAGDPVADDWVFTDSLNIQAGDSLKFWMLLGTPADSILGLNLTHYIDTMQVWICFDQDPAATLAQLGPTIRSSDSDNVWNEYKFDLSTYAGQKIYIGFRYYMNTTADGLWCNIDNVWVGNQSAIGIQQIGNEVPRKFELKQNYPNPFNPITNIEFSVAKTRDVSLVIYNSLGQLVSTLVNQELTPGTYKYDFNATGLPSGSYYYRLTAGDFVQTNKMILVK